MAVKRAQEPATALAGVCWQRDAGFRIDHLLLNSRSLDRLAAAGVDRDARGRPHASDHAPTWVELKDE